MKKQPAETRSLKLSARYVTAKMTLLLETTVRSFGLAALWTGIFICLWLTGFSSSQTTWLFWIVLAIAFAEGTLKFKFPQRADILSRLEKDSDLPHRPLQGLADRPASDGNMELWRLEKERQRQILSKLKFPIPSFDLARSDPYALRIAFIVFVLCALVVSPQDFTRKIKNGLFLPENTRVAEVAAPTVQVSITPPAYSGEKIQILTQAASNPIPVLQGSVISAEVTARWGHPVLVMGTEKLPLTRKEDSDLWTINAKIPETSHIGISSFGFSKFNQAVTYVSDKPADIAWNGNISVLPGGEMKIPLKVSDDYGIRNLTLRGILSAGDSRPLFGSRLEVEKKINLSLRHSSSDISPVFDATGHPWAGWKVSLIVEAEDYAGNVSETIPLDMVLPTRVFHNPVALRLSEIRNLILTMRGTLDHLVDGVNEILTQPEVYHWDTIMTLGLRSVSGRLTYASNKDDLESAAGLIWPLAMRMENGRVDETQKSLQEALQNLQEALQNGADKSQITKLMEEMQQALVQHLQTMANKLQSLMQKSDKLQLQQTLNVSSLAEFIRKLQQEIQSGDSDSALKKLNELQQMAEMMGSSMSQGVPKDVQDMMENLEALQDMILRQKKLLDTTKAPGTKDLPKMTREQKDIKNTAEELTAKIPVKIPPFENAKDEMAQSAQALGDGKPADSIPHQEKILEQLGKSNQSMQQQLQQKLQNMMGISMGSAGGRQDPLGRGTNVNDDGTEVPDGTTRKKADEIIKTLRERASDMSRPLEERNYYQRLLKQW